MREIIWVSATIVVALLLFRGMKSPALVEPPDDEWFSQNVVAVSAETPVIVKFGAKWCGPCRAMESQLDEVADRLDGKVRIVQVDVDERPELADHFSISGIPDTIIFDDGQAVERDVGYLGVDQIMDLVRPYTR